MTKFVTEQIPNGLIDDVGLCYFDPIEEKLVELTSDASIVINPFEETVRRFYLIKPSRTISGRVPLYFKVGLDNISELLEFKLKTGEERLSYVGDYYETPPNNTITIYSSPYPSGIIPLDVYCKSKTNNSISYNLEFTIEVY